MFENIAATSYSRQSRFVSHTQHEVMDYITLHHVTLHFNSIGIYERAGLTILVPVVQPAQRYEHKNITHAQEQNTEQKKTWLEESNVKSNGAKALNPEKNLQNLYNKNVTK